MVDGRSAEYDWRDHYNRSAGRYDAKEWLWGVLLGYSDREERRKLVARLELEPGQRLLEVSAGTGSSLVEAAASGRDAKLVGADISSGMLGQCRRKLAARGVPADLVESDATHLPFKSGVFDAVLHFGAISMFPDKKTAINEIVRVARPGARIVIGDVGVSPERGGLRRALLLKANPRYGERPATDLIAPHTTEHRVSWFRNDTCYVIEFTKGGTPQ